MIIKIIKIISNIIGLLDMELVIVNEGIKMIWWVDMYRIYKIDSINNMNM